MFSIRIVNADGTFHAYLSNGNRKAWSKANCRKLIRECLRLPHFAGLFFRIVPYSK